MELRSELMSAVTRHYTELTTRFDDIYGYSLFSEDGISSVSPVSNRTSTITQSDLASPTYFRVHAAEWSQWDDFGMFATVNQLLKEHMSVDYEVVDDFAERRASALALFLDVLVELERDGLFGERDDSRIVMVYLSDSGDTITDDSVKALNSAAVAAEYATEA